MNVNLLRRGLRVEYASLAWMTVECVVAVYSGIAAWSLALLAFGGDSVIELLSSFAVVQHLRTSVGCQESLNGHEETDGTQWATALLLVSLIPIIGVASVYSFIVGIRPAPSLLGIGVATAAVIIMPTLWFEKKHIGVASQCCSLTIDSVESATCFWMSAALVSGLLLNYVWKIPWIDYLATFVILVFVTKEAFEAINEARGEQSVRSIIRKGYAPAACFLKGLANW
jgi:divalent metal cation (Fe/Co/Zn/Cd) transporter